MNDETDKPEESGADADDQSAQAGGRLAAARRERQISVLEVAKELHLDEAKVRALEKNEFESLGAPVFAKGHLRKYAHLVGVDERDVLADYYALTRSQAIPPVVADRHNKPRRELSPGPWIVAAVVLAVVALAYWALTRKPAPPAPSVGAAVIEESMPSGAEQLPVATGTDEPEAPPVADPEPVATGDVEPEASAEVASDPEPAIDTASEPPADGAVRLTILFLGECWTEIFDASGRRLFYNMGREGQTVDVAGPGPLSVLFGDADNVNLTVNGEAFTIADADRSGRMARFDLSGP